MIENSPDRAAKRAKEFIYGAVLGLTGLLVFGLLAGLRQPSQPGDVELGAAAGAGAGALAGWLLAQLTK